MGGMAALTGYYGLRPQADLFAQTAGAGAPKDVIESSRVPSSEYDQTAKLCFNENPFGPPPSVLAAMTQAFQYANRYGYPDGDIQQVIAAHHGVRPGNILLGAGSTEILEGTAATLLSDHKKVIGVEPTFGTVYEYATGLSAGAIRLELNADHRVDIPAMIEAAKEHASEVGFVYLCNPNNPTGVIVAKQEIKQLLDGIPDGMPVLIDEAYHHFVEDPTYATSVPYVLEGRPVIIARTFSKIAALAGMRIGYAVAPEPIISRMRAHIGSFHVNALAKWGAVAAIKDTDAQNQVRTKILGLRKKTTAELTELGFKVIPSEANFFMVDLRRPVMPVIRDFARKQILVGRPFPPMLNYLRVSVGNEDEMNRFIAAFKQIVT
jgi:histidinol-phosphate aminotransferase